MNTERSSKISIDRIGILKALKDSNDDDHSKITNSHREQTPRTRKEIVNLLKEKIDELRIKNSYITDEEDPNCDVRRKVNEFIESVTVARDPFLTVSDYAHENLPNDIVEDLQRRIKEIQRLRNELEDSLDS